MSTRTMFLVYWCFSKLNIILVIYDYNYWSGSKYGHMQKDCKVLTFIYEAWHELFVRIYTLYFLHTRTIEAQPVICELYIRGCTHFRICYKHCATALLFHWNTPMQTYL